MVDSLTVSAQQTAPYLLPEWSLSNTFVFSVSHNAAFLYLGVILNGEITTNKKHTHESVGRKMALNRSWKGQLFSKQKPESMCHRVWPRLGMCVWGDKACCFVHSHKSRASTAPISVVAVLPVQLLERRILASLDWALATGQTLTRHMVCLLSYFHPPLS